MVFAGLFIMPGEIAAGFFSILHNKSPARYVIIEEMGISLIIGYGFKWI
jgi:hypothetical protein